MQKITRISHATTCFSIEWFYVMNCSICFDFWTLIVESARCAFNSALSQFISIEYEWSSLGSFDKPLIYIIFMPIQSLAFSIMS